MTGKSIERSAAPSDRSILHQSIRRSQFARPVFASSPMRHGPARGFSFFGISIALFGLTVVALFTTPVLQRMIRAQRVSATLTDLQRFASALEQYAHDHGDWPAAATAPGACPPGLDTTLGATRWSQPTPIGGHYVWLVDTLQRGERIRAAIAIVNTGREPLTLDKALVRELLDQAKGMRAIGWRLRLGFRNEPVFVLEQ
jgi:type II secretory pathway pseudopilin PulG